jgi:hypothetical protein
MRATSALNEEVFSQPGMNREDLDGLIDVLRRFRQAAGDFSEPTSASDPEPVQSS